MPYFEIKIIPIAIIKIAAIFCAQSQNDNFSAKAFGCLLAAIATKISTKTYCNDTIEFTRVTLPI